MMPALHSTFKTSFLTVHGVWAVKGILLLCEILKRPLISNLNEVLSLEIIADSEGAFISQV